MLRLLILLLTLPSLLRAEAPQPTYDIVVYGGTSAAIIAAVQAKKMGKTVIVISPDQHLGGLSSGGLGFTDSGDKSVIGGLSRDFYHRVWQAYQKPEAWKHEAKEKFGNKGQGTVAMDASERTMWIFEPSVAEKVFEDYVKEYQLPVERNEWLDRAHGVEKQDGRIVAITTLSKRRFAGRMFIDATYEGDLMAAAGVSYTFGREANAAFDETLNGIQLGHAKSHQFAGKVDPYVIEGDPRSGLLPRIQEGPVGGKDGEADKKIQAYNFRMCLTKVAANRVEFPKPPGYDPKQYALLARALAQGSTHVFGKFDLIPNAKTDTNNHGPFSTDNIGMNWDYPDASYERRREIIAEHRQYQQGYLYFLANDPAVPAKIREGFAQWGLAKDEFTDNGHWPHQIYVREARRMTADVVVNENHLKRKLPTPRSVGMGSYNMDSHNVQRIVVKDADGKAYVRNEGDVQVNPGRPYPIEYGSLVPKKDQCTNLLVPVCVSCTHIAYGSIRMEPVFMILGQSAATAASLAIDQKIAVQDVPYADLSAKLLADGQVLDRAAGPKAVRREAKELPGITVDDADAKVTGTWTESVASPSFIGAGYRHDGKGENGPVAARFETKLPKSGNYEVFLALVPNTNRASNAAVTIAHARGVTEKKVNLKDRTPANLLSLGIYTFTDTLPASVTVGNQGADGYVVIDAVNWVLKP
ncbi:MAG: FAD-dependent oxidoreductase [Opitutia bacterium AMD-G3]|nr:MAG: FAD-dependent oxidoreductase [Opitutae bacterium AMD-G3]